MRWNLEDHEYQYHGAANRPTNCTTNRSTNCTTNSITHSIANVSDFNHTYRNRIDCYNPNWLSCTSF